MATEWLEWVSNFAPLLTMVYVLNMRKTLQKYQKLIGLISV
jgi:hypothetical protein